MDELGIPILIVAAIWGGYSQVMKALEIQTRTRDLIHNIAADGERLSVEQKMILLKHEYGPWQIGIVAFLCLFSGAIASIPQFRMVPTTSEYVASYVLALFVLISAISLGCAGYRDYKRMHALLERTARSNSNHE